MSKREREGLLWILVAAAGFAFTPTVVKTVFSHSDFQPLDLALWRFIIAAPLMWGLVGLKNRSLRPMAGRGISLAGAVIMGIIFAADVLLAFFSLERLPGSVYIVLFYTYPAMVVIFSALRGESLGPRAWLALAMTLAGVGLTVPDVVLPDALDAGGVMLALLNAAGVAAYYLMARRVLAGVEDVSRATAAMMVSALAVLLLTVPARGLQLPQNPMTLFGMFCIATLGTVIPVFATNMGIQRIGPSRASLVATVEPVLGMTIAMILLGEEIVALQWLGAALIVASVIILQRRSRGRPKIQLARETG